MDTFRVAIVSDLHVYEGERVPPPSTISTATPDSDPAGHPVAGLEKLISDASMTADLLVCPGDLSDRASKAGTIVGWSMIGRIAKTLQGAEVLATAGNHDLTSRPDGPDPAHDPEETLRQLSPRFPYDTRGHQQSYFSDKYAVVDGDDWRAVTINSAAHHGRGQREFDHGRITAHTRTTLMRDLRAADRIPSINLALCHHHPVEFTDVDEPDRSSIVGGALMVRELGVGDTGRWVWIHGHKHVPNIAYGPGSTASPVIFSAGSFSAAFHLGQQSRARNQFYIVEFDLDAMRSTGSGVLARFHSWYWVSRVGWQPTATGSGLPAAGGFGWREDPSILANEIVERIVSSGKTAFSWEELVKELPKIEFVMPDDLKALAESLHQLGSHVILDENGRYSEVSYWIP